MVCVCLQVKNSAEAASLVSLGVQSEAHTITFNNSICWYRHNQVDITNAVFSHEILLLSRDKESGAISQIEFEKQVQKLRVHVGRCLVVLDPKLGRLWLGFILNVKNLPETARKACTPTSFQNVVNSTRLGSAENNAVNAELVLMVLHGMLLNAGYDTRSQKVYDSETRVAYKELTEAGFLPRQDKKITPKSEKAKKDMGRGFAWRFLVSAKFRNLVYVLLQKCPAVFEAYEYPKIMKSRNI